MAKAKKPTEPGADAIPVELLRGKEEPEGEDPAPIEPDARLARATATPSRLTAADRLFVAGVAAAIVIGGALYLLRKDVAAQYDLQFHPERYWAGQVDTLRITVKLAELSHRECMVELLAARVKESIQIARNETLGITSSNARAWAADETTAQERSCLALANLVTKEREQLASAELEFEEAEENYRIAAGLIPRQSPGFVAAWQSAAPTWAEIEASPKYKALVDAGKESVRSSYWRDVVSPAIPTEELRRARRQFEELTAANRKR